MEAAKQTSDGGFETLVRFEVETSQQDAVVTRLDARGSMHREFVQFKFSLDPDRSKIQPAELEKIANALRASEEAANAHEPLPSRFVLRTNRPLSASSRAAVEAARRGAPNITLDQKIVKPKGKKKQRIVQPRNPAFRQMLKELKYDPLDPADADRKLKEYARCLGVNQQHELDKGIDSVMSLMLRAASSPASRCITPEQLKSQLTGYPSPRSLVLNDLAPRLAQSLANAQKLRLGLPNSDVLQPRQSFSEFQDLTDEALVVIWGDGGCGKSVLLWNLLTASLEGRSTTRNLAAAMFAGEHTAMTIGQLVASWRSEIGTPPGTDPPKTAISRLNDANPNIPPPILLLGLDGLDELPQDAPWRHAVQEAITYFWELDQQRRGFPPARLFVTCRRKEDVGQFINSRGFGPVGRPPRYVFVTDFTDSEFQALCRDSLQPEIADRLVATEVGNPLVPSTYLAGAVPDRPPKSKGNVTSEAVTKALRHPMVWRCFAMLDVRQQSAALDGNSNGTNQIWQSYERWFYEKAKLRGSFDPLTSKTMLAAVARHTVRGGDVFGLTADWIAPINNVTHRGELSARQFYGEALSAGLLTAAPAPGGSAITDPDRWMWRHVPFWSYLRQ